MKTLWLLTYLIVEGSVKLNWSTIGTFFPPATLALVAFGLIRDWRRSRHSLKTGHVTPDPIWWNRWRNGQRFIDFTIGIVYVGPGIVLGRETTWQAKEKRLRDAGFRSEKVGFKLGNPMLGTVVPDYVLRRGDRVDIKLGLKFSELDLEKRLEQQVDGEMWFEYEHDKRLKMNCQLPFLRTAT